MAPSTARYAHTRAILGPELFDKLANARILVVGAGGIGCELIKNLVMSGFGSGTRGEIQVLDLDTIDLSNLNRQFLFQKQHVKRPKAVVARETALKFNPNVNITALHRNIKDEEYDVDYFKSFDFVMNALDNLDARRHVNKMCLAADIPLLESGTSGYVGQVQPIKRETTECFDCTGKPVPKTFAVCTIRSTPSTAHHCIAWAKSYLFPQLFGADDEADQQELDDAEKNGENVDEIQNLRQEANAIRELRATLGLEGAARRVFDKVYIADIERLLKMEDMWAHRKPPRPLSWDELSAPTPDEPAPAAAVEPNGVPEKEGEKANGKDEARIGSQKKLTVRDSFALFVDAVTRLSARFDPQGEPLAFDKDDEDTLDFVVGAANLRAAAFDIESQTKFQVKEYAGNIIPAIATTNAIIAAALVHQALNVLRGAWSAARTIWLKRTPQRVFDVSPLSAPNPHCAVCRVAYVPVRVARDVTLGEFVRGLVGEGKAVPFEGVVAVQEGTRLVWESDDFEDNADKTLVELEMGEGKFVTVTDDDEPHWPVQFCIGAFLPEGSTPRLQPTLSSLPSPIPLRAPPPAPSADASDASDGEDADLLAVVEGGAADGPEVGAPGAGVSGKKRGAEEAGLEGAAGEGAKKRKEEVGVVVLDDEDVVIDLT
ncbi:E1 ubiquitin-activating protein uba2 [Rhodotorula kratochvilovae]